MALSETVRPGGGLRMPSGKKSIYEGYDNTSPECWEVYTGVLGMEYSQPSLFGRVHHLTVDTYAVQHADRAHPDKSIALHLVGRDLVLERGMMPSRVPGLLQRLAGRVKKWPHFSPSLGASQKTILVVALAPGTEEHVPNCQEWARSV